MIMKNQMIDDPNHTHNDGNHSTLSAGANNGIKERKAASLELIAALRTFGRESCARAAQTEHFQKFGEPAQ